MMDADSDAKARIAKLEETLRGLEADGYGDALEPLRTELAAVKKSLEAPAPAPPPPPPPPEKPIQAWTPPEETAPEPAAPPPPIKAWTPEPEPPAPAPRPVEPPAPVPPAPPVTSRMNALRSKTEPGYVAPTSKPATAGAQGVNFWDAINPFKAPESAEARAARIARNEERALETEARRRREEEAEARRRAENAARREERVTADAARIKLQLAVDAAAAALTKDANLFKWSGEARRAAILAEFEAVIEALPQETNEASLSRTDQTSAKEAQASPSRRADWTPR